MFCCDFKFVIIYTFFPKICISKISEFTKNGFFQVWNPQGLANLILGGEDKIKSIHSRPQYGLFGPYSLYLPYSEHETGTVLSAGLNSFCKIWDLHTTAEVNNQLLGASKN